MPARPWVTSPMAFFLTPPGDIDQLAGRLEELSELLPGRSEIRQAARACATRFTWENFREGIRQALGAPRCQSRMIQPRAQSAGRMQLRDIDVQFPCYGIFGLISGILGTAGAMLLVPQDPSVPGALIASGVCDDSWFGCGSLCSFPEESTFRFAPRARHGLWPFLLLGDGPPPATVDRSDLGFDGEGLVLGDWTVHRRFLASHDAVTAASAQVRCRANPAADTCQARIPIDDYLFRLRDVSVCLFFGFRPGGHDRRARSTSLSGPVVTWVSGRLELVHSHHGLLRLPIAVAGRLLSPVARLVPSGNTDSLRAIAGDVGVSFAKRQSPRDRSNGRCRDLVLDAARFAEVWAAF